MRGQVLNCCAARGRLSAERMQVFRVKKGSIVKNICSETLTDYSSKSIRILHPMHLSRVKLKNPSLPGVDTEQAAGGVGSDLR